MHEAEGVPPLAASHFAPPIPMSVPQLPSLLESSLNLRLLGVHWIRIWRDQNIRLVMPAGLGIRHRKRLGGI